MRAVGKDVAMVLAVVMVVLSQSGTPAAVASGPALSLGNSDAALWSRVVGVLQYVEGDYPAALSSGDASELEEQRAFIDDVVHELEQGGSPSELERARALAKAVADKAPGETVSAACRAFSDELMAAHDVKRAPSRVPELGPAAAQFQALCATCHGATGDGKGPAGAALTPPPANFHDAARMGVLTPFKIFNTIGIGVKGTSMPAFTQLSEHERWGLAFFVSTLRQPPCVGSASASLDELATSTDAQLAASHGADSVACLRRVLPELNTRSTLLLAKAGVERAAQAAKAGQISEARAALVDAYLQGVEPVEPTLRTRDAALVSELEQAFTQARLAVERGEDLSTNAATLSSLLSRAEATKSAGDFWSVFFAAMLILVREGFEATVVVGALLAVLKKMNATKQANVVHAGWISALIFGAVAFFFGHRLLAGANREWMESVVSLAAVGMLLYAALWLNARANMSKFMGELREKMKSALGSGSLAGLFIISFTSVGRESVETALFLEGLAGDSQQGVMWGAIAGLATLAALVAFVRTIGFVLPMKALFNASTVVLVGTAVMLLGKGFHGLQELGVLGLHPVRFVRVEALGVFPDAWSLGPQAVLLLAPLVWWAIKRRNSRIAAQRSKPSPTFTPG